MGLFKEIGEYRAKQKENRAAIAAARDDEASRKPVPPKSPHRRATAEEVRATARADFDSAGRSRVVTINGNTYQGRNIKIAGDDVWIDGVKVDPDARRAEIAQDEAKAGFDRRMAEARKRVEEAAALVDEAAARRRIRSAPKRKSLFDDDFWASFDSFFEE